MQRLAEVFRDHAERKGLIGVVVKATSLGLDLEGDPTVAVEALKALRLAKRFEDAKILAIQVSQASSATSQLVLYCLHVLHRLRAYPETLDLLGQLKATRAVRISSVIQTIEADCHQKTGRARLARHLIKKIKSERLPAAYAKLVTDINESKLPSIDVAVKDIEQMFEAGRLGEAVSAFHSFLGRSRPVSTPSHAARDNESQRYANEFETDIAHGHAFDRKQKHVITIITDSIGLPRPSIGVQIIDTYPWRLREKIRADFDAAVEVLPHCRRGRTIREVRQLVPVLSHGTALVIQVGIVDCAPRVFSEKDLVHVENLYGSATAEAMTALASIYRRNLQRPRKESVYVPLWEFEKLLNEVLELACPRFKFIELVNIVSPGRGGAKQTTTDLAKNVLEYNEMIAFCARRHNVGLIDLDAQIWGQNDASTYFSGDNYHYNAKGHKFCAGLLAERLKGLFEISGLTGL